MIDPPAVRYISSDRLVETTLDLVAFDTTNPPGDTREIVEWIDRFLEERNVETTRFVAEESKPNILATVPGASDRRLLYSGHLDTVPFDPSGWSRNPFGERDGDRIYGRGTVDMKGAIAAMLHLAESIDAADRIPPLTLDFAFVSDEEIGGLAGTNALVDAEMVAADACIIGEPTCSGERHSMTVADRGSIWLTIEATGEAAHGSRPMLGENAIDRLWPAVADIRRWLERQTLSVPASVEPIIEESVAYYAPSLGQETAAGLFDRPSVNLGRLEGGEAVNSVPRAARAELDIRVTPGIDTEPITEDIRRLIDEHAQVAITDVSRSVGTFEALDSPLVSAVGDVAEDVLGGRVYRRSATGGGDAKQLRNAGIPTVEFAVGNETPHACDEYTTVESLVATAEVYARVPAVLAERLAVPGSGTE